ncbi:hypothetical protein MHU86_17458 [Fragilaria crotonensis]|nr:hypothetical protein MHU86_17458 [Fragilaria crotonensis]
MSIIVPRCGFNRNTKKAILFGPLALGGACFRSLSVQRGISQVMTFIRQWRKQSTAGKLLHITVSWFQAQVGVSFSFLDCVHDPFPHLESKWLRSLRSFLATINAKLRLDTPYLPELQRLHDFCIMDVILSSGKFTSVEICKLNYCRLYLKAVTLSDLTCINGRKLDHNKTSGIIHASVAIPVAHPSIRETIQVCCLEIVEGGESPLEYTRRPPDSTPSPPIAGTFTHYIASLPSWEKELLDHVELTDDPFMVAVALEHGIRAVGDGSDWHQIQGAFGWALSTDQATDSQSLIDTVQQKQAPAASLNGATVPSDTDMATIPSFPLEPTLPEWDVLRGSQALLHDMPQLALQHVKGHQDRDFPYRHLSLLAQLNVDADAQALRYQRKFGQSRPDVLMTEWAGVHRIS